MSRKPVPSGLVDVTEGEDAGERETPVSGPGQMRPPTGSMSGESFAASTVGESRVLVLDVAVG